MLHGNATKQEEIVRHFKTFPVSSRDQLLRLYFDNDKKKIRLLNDKLNKLRLKHLIRANTEIKPYLYFSSPPRIHRRSSRLDHHLAVVDFYIWLKEEAEKRGEPAPEPLAVEYSFGRDLAKPDLVIRHQGEIWFVEVQRTVITEQKMKYKIKLYEKTKEQGLHKEFGDDFGIWIVAPKRYDIETDLKVYQSIMTFPILIT